VPHKIQYWNDKRRLQLNADEAQQTAVVISKTRPGFEQCISRMLCSCFILFIERKFVMYILFIFRVTCYGSVLHTPLPNTKDRRTLYLITRDAFALNYHNHGHNKWRARQNATLPHMWPRQPAQASLPSKWHYSSHIFLVCCTPNPCFTL
jgi:hypothetical protein